MHMFTSRGAEGLWVRGRGGGRPRFAESRICSAAHAAPLHLKKSHIGHLKHRCAAAWRAYPVKVGTRPFKAEAWKYFYPCEDFSDVDDGVVLDPYDGKVKSIFLDDDQKPLSRKGG